MPKGSYDRTIMLRPIETDELCKVTRLHWMHEGILVGGTWRGGGEMYVGGGQWP